MHITTLCVAVTVSLAMDKYTVTEGSGKECGSREVSGAGDSASGSGGSSSGSAEGDSGSVGFSDSENNGDLRACLKHFVYS